MLAGGSSGLGAPATSSSSCVPGLYDAAVVQSPPFGHRDHRVLLMRVGLGQQDVEPMRAIPGLGQAQSMIHVRSGPRRMFSGLKSGGHRASINSGVQQLTCGSALQRREPGSFGPQSRPSTGAGERRGPAIPWAQIAHARSPGHFRYNEMCRWTVLLDDGVRAPAALASAAETAYGDSSRAQLPGTPDGNLASADVHALYLAGEREAVTAGDHREVAKEPAVRDRPPRC